MQDGFVWVNVDTVEGAATSVCVQGLKVRCVRAKSRLCTFAMACVAHVRVTSCIERLRATAAAVYTIDLSAERIASLGGSMDERIFQVPLVSVIR